MASKTVMIGQVAYQTVHGMPRRTRRMTEETSDRAEALFYEAIDLLPEEQRALLLKACDGDPGLLAQLEKLLAEDARLRTGRDTRHSEQSPRPCFHLT